MTSCFQRYAGPGGWKERHRDTGCPLTVSGWNARRTDGKGCKELSGSGAEAERVQQGAYRRYGSTEQETARKSVCRSTPPVQLPGKQDSSGSGKNVMDLDMAALRTEIGIASQSAGSAVQDSITGFDLIRSQGIPLKTFEESKPECFLNPVIHGVAPEDRTDGESGMPGCELHGYRSR